MTNCGEFRARLTELVDGDLEPEVHRLTAAHVAGCEDCGRLVRDLTAIRETANRLGPIPPSDHLWLGIAGQVRLDRGAAARPAPARAAGRGAVATSQWAGLAAALLLVTVGIWVVSQAPSDDAGPSAGAAISAADLVAAELDSAAEHYERAIATLDAMEAAGELPADAMLTTMLRDNLGVVDRAIADSRAALEADPGNPAARSSLFDALRQKVDLLQATALLMNDVRQNSAEEVLPAGRSGPSSS